MPFLRSLRLIHGVDPVYLIPGIQLDYQGSQGFSTFSHRHDNNDHDNGGGGDDDDDDDMKEFDQELEGAIEFLQKEDESGAGSKLGSELLQAFGPENRKPLIGLLAMMLENSRKFAGQKNDNNRQGGRDVAIAFLEPFKDGTLGKLVFHAAEPFWEVFGNAFSDKVGEHYMRHLEPVLRLKATRENIRLVAIVETRWWRSRGLAGTLGKLMTAKRRELILRSTHAKLAKRNPEKWNFDRGVEDK